MKKSFIIFFVLFIAFSVSDVFAYPKTLDGKLGTSYLSDPEKFGWQLNFAYLTELDPFFALGFEPGIFWANWDRKVGRKEVNPGVYADVKADTNAYVVPLLADAQIRLPNLQKKLNVLPYVSFGLGYSFMMLKYSSPEYFNGTETVPAKNKTEYFHGLTWQILLGIAYDPGMSSKIRFLAEAGYRGAKLKKGTLEVDMSGLVFNFGIKYPLGSEASSN